MPLAMDSERLAANFMHFYVIRGMKGIHLLNRQREMILPMPCNLSKMSCGLVLNRDERSFLRHI